jgi:hypothetical protein
VLKHRADAQHEAFARRADPDRPAMGQDLARIGLLHAGKHADQRRFAGPVLAQEDVNLAGPEVERDIVVGDDAREPLGDAAQGKHRGLARGGGR